MEGGEAAVESQANQRCDWPSYLDAGGPGACTVGRAYVECQYPVGVTCDGGPSVTGVASGPSGTSSVVTELCISDDPTRCGGGGCTSIGGKATCTDKCAANEYAVACGGPPAPPLPDGGVVDWTYQDPPDGCVSAGGIPSGAEYYCCACQ